MVVILPCSRLSQQCGADCARGFLKPINRNGTTGELGFYVRRNKLAASWVSEGLAYGFLKGSVLGCINRNIFEEGRLDCFDPRYYSPAFIPSLIPIQLRPADFIPNFWRDRALDYLQTFEREDI